MDGTQPGDPEGPDPARSRASRRRRIGIGLVVAAVVLASGVAAYVLTRPPPIPLTVTDGSTSALFEATFIDYTYTDHPIERNYTATSTAGQADGPTSSLTLELQTDSFFDAGQNTIDVDVRAVVVGSFASNLRPTALTLSCNQTDYGNPWGWALPGTTNVSYDPNHVQMISVAPGHNAFTPTLENQTGPGPLYDFAFPALVLDGFPVRMSQFSGFRATVTGPFTPSVSVGIVLHLVDIPWFPSQYWALITRSADRADWILNLTNGWWSSNQTTDLTVTTINGTVVVPEVALGSLYTSPYRDTIAYLPANGTSGIVAGGDRIEMSAAAYTSYYLVQIYARYPGTLEILWECTLG